MREIVLPDCPPPIFALGHSTGATILIRAAHRGHRWFDRMVLTSPLITLGGVDYSMGAGAIIIRAMRWAGFGSMYVPKSDTSIVESRPFVGNILTSDPVRYARNAAILEAEPALALGAPTVAWLDSAFRAMAEMHERSFPAHIRQPMLIVAGGSDAIVSTSAIEDFASLLRAGSHLVIVGAQHEILMEQDRFRSQFWAAFDAFVPGTPLY
jgi:lysophospholipase